MQGAGVGAGGRGHPEPGEAARASSLIPKKTVRNLGFGLGINHKGKKDSATGLTQGRVSTPRTGKGCPEPEVCSPKKTGDPKDLRISSATPPRGSPGQALSCISSLAGGGPRAGGGQAQDTTNTWSGNGLTLGHTTPPALYGLETMSP